MTVVPLGDQAILAYLPTEAAAVALTTAARTANPDWLFDVVPAYASVGLFFDGAKVTTDAVIGWLRKLPKASAGASPAARRVVIPVCYDFPLDLPRVAEATGLTADDVIRLHTGRAYTVYAIGFVPGFPYLGYLPAELCGVPRLPSPRVRVEPGSVGLTGRQTGVYPLAKPGGWPLIGRTPLTLVDVAAGFFPLRVGDAVTFERIGPAEFRRRDGERLG